MPSRSIPVASMVLAGVLLTAAMPASVQAAPASPESRACARALKLLGLSTEVVVRVVDPELAAEPEAIRRVDAFLVRERDGRLRQIIYLNRRSAPVERALEGRDIDIAILAAIIRHEIEHLRGAGEPGARLAERAFFQGLVFAGRVPSDEGLAYLAELTQVVHLREAR